MTDLAILRTILAHSADDNYLENISKELRNHLYYYEDLTTINSLSTHPFYQAFANITITTNVYYYLDEKSLYCFVATGLSEIPFLLIFAFNKAHVYLNFLLKKTWNCCYFYRIKKFDVDKFLSFKNLLVKNDFQQSIYLKNDVIISENLVKEDVATTMKNIENWNYDDKTDVKLSAFTHFLLSLGWTDKHLLNLNQLVFQQENVNLKLSAFKNYASTFSEDEKLALNYLFTPETTFYTKDVINRLAVNQVLNNYNEICKQLKSLPKDATNAEITNLALNLVRKQLLEKLPKTKYLVLKSANQQINWLNLSLDDVEFMPKLTEIPDAVEFLVEKWNKEQTAIINEIKAQLIEFLSINRV